MTKRRISRRKHKRSMRGGYTSATTYAESVSGNAASQFSRTMEHGGNDLIGTSGQGTIPSSHLPTSAQLALVQSAGRRRRKRGGFLGQVLSQAAVPLGLLGMQQTYRRNKHGGKGTKRRR